MPNDPYDRLPKLPDWSAGHATTLRGLDHIACVIPDLETSLAFFTGQLDGELLADERIGSPQPARRVLIRLGDTNVALIQPDDREHGVLGEYLRPPTVGVYAMVWRVADEAAAHAFVQQKGLRVTREGCVSGGLAILPEDFHGARHEFVGGSV
jgi:catechol 2,3-dioxygenase-like lactoylglutathione lyase family enzyme